MILFMWLLNFRLSSVVTPRSLIVFYSKYWIAFNVIGHICNRIISSMTCLLLHTFLYEKFSCHACDNLTSVSLNIAENWGEGVKINSVNNSIQYNIIFIQLQVPWPLWRSLESDVTVRADYALFVTTR